MNGIIKSEGYVYRDDLKSKPGNLTLPYIRYSNGSQGSDNPAIFFLGGGPGVTNLNFTPPAWLVEKFDVVVIEYRGVGGSSIVLNAPQFGTILKKVENRLDLNSAESLRPYFDLAFLELVKQGIVMDEFSVAGIAEDVELVRKELGYQQINFLAHSFGTRIASYYQSKYRDNVTRSVLFALNTPGGFVWEPKETATVLSRYQQKLEAVMPEKAKVMAELIEGPMVWPQKYMGMSVNPAKSAFGAFMLSFNQHTFGYTADIMINSSKSNTFGAFAFDLVWDLMIPLSFNWGDFFMKALNSDCNEALIKSADRDSFESPFQSPSSILFGGYREFEAAGGNCHRVEPELNYDNSLAVMGEFDLSTPLERVAKILPPEQIVVVENMGHAEPLYQYRERGLQLAYQYFLHGEVIHNIYPIPKLATPKPLWKFF